MTTTWLEKNLNLLGHHKVIILAFVVGFIIRLVPELLSFPHPIGWDTIYYASRMSSAHIFTVGSDIVNSWLVYGILVTVSNLTKLDPFIILKIFAPIIFGGTCTAIYFVSWKRLKWSPTKSILTSTIFSLQLASLAISWQFLRNTLGIMILLFTLPYLKNNITKKQTINLTILAIFTVWSHELAMASLFFIVFVMLIRSKLKKQKTPKRLFIAILPALLLFTGNLFYISPFASPINPNLTRVDDSNWAHPAGLFFITDYLNTKTPIENYTSYTNLASNVTTLFLILYALTLPLTIIGYFKDNTLTIWTILLLIGGLSCLIIPFFAIFLWARWILLLTYPFTFYTTNGLWKITKEIPSNKILLNLQKFKLTKTICITLLVTSTILASLFMACPLNQNNEGLIEWGGSAKYVPSTMQTTSIPLRDIEATKKAYQWLNNNMNNNSALLAHDTFDTWTMLYLKPNHKGYLFDFNIQQAAKRATTDGYQTIYFVWWNQTVEGQQLHPQDNWTKIQQFNRITIYRIN
jgi:hypothetical protein